MDRSAKVEAVEELRAGLATSSVVVITHQLGLTVAEVTDLRSKMRAAGGQFKVVKNTLARLAVQGTAYEGLAEKFVGPVAIGFSEDPVVAAKVLVSFADSNDRLKVVVGAMGEKALALRDVESLAKLPSLDVLRGKLVGVLQAPAAKLVGIAQAPAAQIARVVAAYARKNAA